MRTFRPLSAFFLAATLAFSAPISSPVFAQSGPAVSSESGDSSGGGGRNERPFPTSMAGEGRNPTSTGTTEDGPAGRAALPVSALIMLGVAALVVGTFVFLARRMASATNTPR